MLKYVSMQCMHSSEDAITAHPEQSCLLIAVLSSHTYFVLEICVSSNINYSCSCLLKRASLIDSIACTVHSDGFAIELMDHSCRLQL